MRSLFFIPLCIVLMALPDVGSGRLLAQHSGHLSAGLVIAAESIAPGVPFLAAASFEMEQEWHIYWRNPGDAGLATEVEWMVPEGFVVEQLGWPIPQLFGEAPEVTYGYDGKVLLPVRITPPADLKPGSRIEISAAARWLVCKEACIPGRQTLRVMLPVEATPRSNADAEKQIAGTIQSLPTVAEGEGMTASMLSAGDYLITIPDRYLAGEEAPSFLPYFESMIDHSAPQRVVKFNGGVLLQIPVSPFASEKAERLQGILVQRSAEGARAIEIDLPLRTGEPVQN